MPDVVYNPPSACPGGLLGKKLGHAFRQIIDADTDEENTVMCARCGLIIGPPLTQRHGDTS